MAHIRLQPVPTPAHGAASLTFAPVGGGGAAQGEFPFKPYGSLQVPPEPIKARLFADCKNKKGAQFEGGPELAFEMADGRGHMVPMEENAQKLLCEQIGKEALAHFSEQQCKKIVNVVMTTEGIVFYFQKSKKHVEPKTIPWEGAGKTIDHGYYGDKDSNPLVGETALEEFVRSEKVKEKNEQILDLRPLRALPDRTSEKDKELPARKGLRDLMYFIMLSHQEIGDNLHQRGKTPFSELEPAQIPEAMTNRFSHLTVASGNRRP